MSKKVKINPVSFGQIDIDVLEEFQGTMKSLTKDSFEKLRNEILKTGFAFPVFLWKHPNKSVKIIGGHQRVRVLKTMRKMGTIVPKIPAVYIHAENEREARRRVIQDAAQYGEFDDDGLAEFLHESQIEVNAAMEAFRIPDRALDRLFASLKENPPEELKDEDPAGLERSASQGVIKVQLTFDEENHRKFQNFCQVLSHKYSTTSISDTILMVLQADFES